MIKLLVPIFTIFLIFFIFNSDSLLQVVKSVHCQQPSNSFFCTHFLILHQGLPPPSWQVLEQRNFASPSRVCLKDSYSPKNGTLFYTFFSFAALISLRKFLAASDTVFV